MACKCREIYKAALRIIGESEQPDISFDYEERAPYIMAIFCNEAKSLDSQYRKANSFEEAPEFNGISIGLDDDFPLSARFFSVAVSYMAAMLVIDEDPELSDRFFEKYCTYMMSIRTDMSLIKEQTVQKYE